MKMLPALSRIDFYRLTEDEFIGVLAHAIEKLVQQYSDVELSDRHVAVYAWARMAVDVPNGGFTQFFYNHRGDLGVAPLAKLLSSLDLAKPAQTLRDALKIYRKHRAEFAVENPWNGLFGSIKEFDKLDRAMANLALRCTRTLVTWIRANINKLATDELGSRIDPHFTGTVEILHPNGVVHESLEVKKGKPSGAYRVFFDDGSVMKGVFYKAGKISGDFWPTGQVKRKQSKKGKLTITEWYYPSGKLLKRYVRNSDGYTTEPVRMYHENGQLAEELHLAQGNRRGPWLKFFEDGSPQLQAEYLAGEKLHVRNAWDADRTQTVRDGAGVLHNDGRRIDWEYDLYFPNYRDERDSVEVQDGVPHGMTTTYSDGRIERETEYRNGVREGKSTWYWENGRVRSVTTFKNGRASKTKEYPRLDHPVPAVVLTIEAHEKLYAAWEHMPVDEYPRVLNRDEIQGQFKMPTFLQEVFERNRARKLESDYEDWHTFNDGIAYFLMIDEKGAVASARANGSGVYSGGEWDTYLPLLHQLRFTPGSIRGRAVPCQVLARVDHTFVEGAAS
ncbi:MAG TPA: DUF4375 domain-containing protein [Gemmataceae bacterium]|nr:DUF4375 domain-containing protein [Gemmataceae bacterium]